MRTMDFIGLDEKKTTPVVNALQQLLADMQVYYANLRGFHWEIKGHGFFVLHEKFESLYDDVAAKVDEVAERILMLGASPKSRFSDYLQLAQVKETAGVECGEEAVAHILDTLRLFIAQERSIIALAQEAGDDVTADLLTGYLKEQEKLVWMLIAFSTKACKR